MAKKDWQDQWRSALAEYDERVPDALWESVSASVSQRWRRRRIRRAWVRGGVCGAILAAAVATILVVVRPRPGDGTAPAPLLVQAPAELPADPPAAPHTEALVPVPAQRPAPPPRPSFAHDTDMPEPETPAADLATDLAAEEPAGTAEDAAPAAGRPEERPRRSGDAVRETETVPPVGLFREDPVRAAARRRRTELRLALSNMNGSRSGSAGYGAMFGSDVVSLLSAPLSAQGDSYSAVLLENNFREVSTEVRHHQPVRLALTAAWGLGGRLALESGLSYSCLVSDMRSGTDASRYDIRQTLHYLGIPLRLNVQLWSQPRFELYLSGGVMLEKCVGGKSVTSYYVDNALIGSGRERLVEEPLQWSAGLSAGAAYKLGGRFRLFAEPGARLYFDNGSFVQTLYGDRPFHFDFSVGLRCELGR